MFACLPFAWYWTILETGIARATGTPVLVDQATGVPTLINLASGGATQ